jgi:dihydrolipoamide dehydrogenase
MEKFDVVVIGSGPGGYPAAIRAAQLGASVAVVEKEHLGGTCLNWGCIPTKTLISASDLYWRMKHAGDLGLKPGRATYDFAAMLQRKTQVVDKLRGGIGMLFKGNGIEVFHGTGSLVSRHRVAVHARRKDTVLDADKIIIASGSESVMPGFLPRHANVMESRAFLDLDALPRSLLVLGGGVIGCEFACMAAQLGVKVTIVEMLEDIMIVLDADVRREVRRHMEKTLGIRVLTGAPLEAITADASGVAGRFENRTVRAEKMLVSVGRRPVSRDVGLDKAGLEAEANGAIKVDAACRTAAANIFAVGDVTHGSTQLAHAATAQGVTAAENAVRGTRSAADHLVPACIFTSPEIGAVGLAEQDAAARDLKVTTGRFAFAALGRAMAAGESEGFVKWVADERTGQLLGAQAVGPHATELIAEAAAAIKAELTLEEIGGTIHCHPTFSEAWMEAAHAAHGECIHAPPRRR